MAKPTPKGAEFMWHVIQTVTGQEELLAQLIREIIPDQFYVDCFPIKRECIRKAGDGWEIYETVMFPGYVFIDTECPNELYYCLKEIPKLTKMLKDEEELFLSVDEEEQEFLENIQSEGHIVRLSEVRLDAEKQIIAADGAVGRYMDCIVKQRIRKRYVLIRKKLLGKERKIILGIRLCGDE